MLVKTTAIVLNYKKYSDSSIIVNCLTDKIGRQSFLVYGIGGRKNNKLAQFQPLFIIDINLYHKNNRSLQKLKEAKLNPPLYSLTSDITKSTLAIFIAEIIEKSITESFTDDNVFEFIKTSILFLDQIETGLGLFHISFLLKMAKLLGILPDLSIESNFINLKDGSTSALKPLGNNYIDKPTIKAWKMILETNYSDLELIKINKALRINYLDSLIDLYETHMLHFGTIKSYPVLKEIFSVD